MNRILVIDDDKELCALIQRCILTEKHRGRLLRQRQRGSGKVKGKEYQLVVLDVMLPGMDGFETMERIRKEYRLPILMFTARNDITSKVRGLRAGADDYLTKPFDMDELTARILSLIRRYTRFNQPEGSSGKLVFDGLTIDADARSVTTSRGTFALPPKEFDLLWLLAGHQGKIFTKQRIYELVWGEEYCYDDSNIMAIISNRYTYRLWRLSAVCAESWKKIPESPNTSRQSKAWDTALTGRSDRMELLTLISVMTAAASVLICVFVIRRVKVRLNEMLDALADIKAGNGSRRILSTTDELTAPIAYEINDIVSSYEKKLAAFRRTQGTTGSL